MTTSVGNRWRMTNDETARNDWGMEPDAEKIIALLAAGGN